MNDYWLLAGLIKLKQITEPPLTQTISIEQLTTAISNREIIEMDIKKLPCHTQAVERCIKLVTESASNVCGWSKRDGFVRTTLKSREMMKEYESKKDFPAKVLSNPLEWVVGWGEGGKSAREQYYSVL